MGEEDLQMPSKNADVGLSVKDLKVVIRKMLQEVKVNSQSPPLHLVGEGGIFFPPGFWGWRDA